jgi:hypothetical protein
VVDQIDRHAVSSTLEHEVHDELRRQGKQVVWLDRDGHYDVFVDTLRERWECGDFPYPVAAYRGSFLELMLQLDELAEGTGRRAVLIHMPGFVEDEMRETPVFEHYSAGRRYRKALSTLVEEAAAGKVAPSTIEAFAGGGDVTLAEADAWFAEQTRETSLLDQLSINELWCRLSTEAGEALPEAEADFEAVLEHLKVRTGLTDAWREFAGVSKTSHELAVLADELAGWALAVEYVDDLRRRPFVDELCPLTELPDKIVEDCHSLAEFLRETSGLQDTYVRIADELDDRLGVEREKGKPEDLGEIDTLRFEEERYLRGAIEALGRERWEDAFSWSDERNEHTSFWVGREPKRGHAWTLVRSAAALGAAVQKQPTPIASAQSLPEAVASYAHGTWSVDLAHRQLEQRRAALLEPGLPEFARLRKRLDDMRRLYREWADDLARRFNDLCEQAGFVPTESLQQRYFFDQVVEPWTHGTEKTAVFMVDALRYEMAEELSEALDDVGTSVGLDARLAELPSITAVGMNALAPVTGAGGRLTPLIKGDKFKGFETSVFQVRDPKTRQKMMRHRAGGRTCPLLDLREVLSSDKDLSKVVNEAALVLVHSQGIDEVGEKGYGQLTFETTLRDIRSAVRLLREAGVQRFVLTSDHGFLLLDATTRTKHAQGKKIDPNARWRLYPSVQKDEDLVSLPLSALNYADTDQCLVMPRDTAIFDTGDRSKNFVHGGNSLQERVIPVLKLEYHRAVGGSTTRYRIDAERGESMMDMHCLSMQVSPEQAMLDLGGADEIELSLRVLDDDDVDVEICSGRGGARVQGASAMAPVDQTVEVFFKLRAETDRRSRVEIYAPTRGESVASKTVDAQFEVVGVGAGTPERTAEPQEAAGESAAQQSAKKPAKRPAKRRGSEGLEAIDDAGARKVFEHILEYGSINEQAATKLIGSTRKFRRFSANFEDYVQMLPFAVEIRWSRDTNLKQYVLKG